jgi:hypothetical protein
LLIDSHHAHHASGFPGLIWQHKAEYHAALACTSGATRPVNISFVIVRRIKVNHHGNVVHVNTTSRYIAGNQCLHFTFGEFRQSAHALVLATTTMNGSSLDASSLEVLRQSVWPVPRAAEDNGRPTCVDCFCYQFVPVASVGLPKDVSCRSNVWGFLTHFVPNSIFLVVAGKLGNIAVQSCGIQHGLAVFWGLVKQTANGRHESHISHAIRFVDHDKIHVTEAHCLLGNEVFQTPGACDQNVYTLA